MQRYDPVMQPDEVMVKSDDGEYVLYSDHLALASADAERIAALENALRNLINPADGCVGVLWKSTDPRSGKHYADQTHKAIKEAEAALRVDTEK